MGLDQYVMTVTDIRLLTVRLADRLSLLVFAAAWGVME
jgi:hypothetical protein